MYHRYENMIDKAQTSKLGPYNIPRLNFLAVIQTCSQNDHFIVIVDITVHIITTATQIQALHFFTRNIKLYSLIRKCQIFLITIFVFNLHLFNQVQPLKNCMEIIYKTSRNIAYMMLISLGVIFHNSTRIPVRIQRPINLYSTNTHEFYKSTATSSFKQSEALIYTKSAHLAL